MLSDLCETFHPVCGCYQGHSVTCCYSAPYSVILHNTFCLEKVCLRWIQNLPRVTVEFSIHQVSADGAGRWLLWSKLCCPPIHLSHKNKDSPCFGKRRRMNISWGTKHSNSLAAEK